MGRENGINGGRGETGVDLNWGHHGKRPSAGTVKRKGESATERKNTDAKIETSYIAVESVGESL